jgi:iron complex outermembrane receptor protein
MAIRNGLKGGISLGAFTIALGAFALPQGALAQEASVEPGDQTESEEEAGIVVTGYRESLETAVNLKRTAPVIAEAFSAEDIGKLPDVSIAETLGRLPGLATQRNQGRAQSVSIRGLGPDYSTSLLNGREVVSSGDNRAVEYDQYPSELIEQGVVYKVPYAGLLGQGLAGTVDLRTIRPLAKNERIVAVSARAEFNEEGSLNPDIRGWGYRATGTYVDQFADDTLGLAVGVSYQSSPSQVERFSAWGYPTDAGFRVLGGMKPFARSNLLDRLGAFATLEWQPSADWNTSLDVFFTDFKENTPLRGIEFPLNPGWGAGTTITANSGGSFPDSVTFANVQPVVRNDYERKDVQNFAVGWNTKYETDEVLLNVDLSYSKSDRRLEQIESYSGLTYGGRPGPADVIVANRQSSGFPFQFTSQVNYADTNLVQLTDPRGWGANGIVQAGFINDTATEDDLWTGRVEVIGKVEHDFVQQLVAGVAYSDRTKARDITQNFLSLSGGPSVYRDMGAVLRRAIPADALLGSVNALSFIGIGPQVAYDPFVLLNNGTYVLTDVQSSSLPFPGDWEVNEKIYTGYLRADLDTMLGSMNLTGNVGTQLVFTDQSSSGFNSPGGIGATLTPVTDGDRYGDFLPSATFNLALADNMKLRLGAARTLTRARMDQLNASQNAGIANQPPALGYNSIFSGGGGNPRLRPYRAWGVDLSYEWYFGGEGYLAVASYYKWLEDFVNPNAAVLRDFSYLVPTLTPTQRAAFLATGSNTLGLVSGPDNTAKGHIFGVEASLALPFRVFSSALDGFGFQTAASYTDSQLTVFNRENTNTFDVTVPGLSEWVVNSTVYFEKSGFEARVSHRYRSEFLAEFIGISASRDFRQTYSESIFDAQVGYRFPEGSSLEGLAFTVQALNLTDEPFVSYTNDDRSHIIDYERYGRTYLVGVSYRM